MKLDDLMKTQGNDVGPRVIVSKQDKELTFEEVSRISFDELRENCSVKILGKEVTFGEERKKGTKRKVEWMGISTYLSGPRKNIEVVKALERFYSLSEVTLYGRV